MSISPNQPPEEILSGGEGDDQSSHSDDEPSPPQPPSQNFFAPPFYGRPPTPLPPSPSLTSLLRPSRPTTPDASDEDNLAPLPHTAPKVPTYEYYGFVLYVLSTVLFAAYLLWAFLPSPFLHSLGVYYYPNRWWALAVPAFIVMLLVYIYVALLSYNVERLTVPMGSVETIVDGAGALAGSGKKGGRGKGETEKETDWRDVWNTGTDAVMDLPLGAVCEILYGEGREHSDLEDYEENEATRGAS